MPKLKTNFTIEIEHKKEAIPEGIKTTVQGGRGLIKLIEVFFKILRGRISLYFHEH